ncbi:MAG: PEP-CTERM sorting domain-containing protein [Nitrospirota bacterium]
MKSKILSIILGLFSTVLMMSNLPEAIKNCEINMAYADGSGQAIEGPQISPVHSDADGSGQAQEGPRVYPVSAVPEPATLALIGSSLSGAGIYLFLRHRNKKK